MVHYSPEVKQSFRRIMEILCGVHTFGCYSAESEPIWMKSGALLLGVALADIGCDPYSSDSLQGIQNLFFFVKQIMHDFTDFSSESVFDI